MISIAWFLKEKEGFQGDFLPHESLAFHTYYKIGGPTPLLLIPKSQADLEWIKRGLHETGAPYRIFGLGSNLLVADAGIDAIVIKISKLNLDIGQVSNTEVRAGASVSVSTLLRKASQMGWSGLEWMTGIPGSLGGVVSMNAGTHLGEAKDSLLKISTFDWEAGAGSFSLPEFHFEYRKNHFIKGSSVITDTFWKIKSDDPEKVKAVIQDTLLRRKTTQPLDYPSCGSVFKNPEGKKAWQVLDELKLRGHQIGQAQFSEKHPNFIVNLKGALAQDVLALIQLAKRRAKAELGIDLHEEVKYLD